jgi:hypothetical protein
MFHFASPYFLPNPAYSFYPQPHYQLCFFPQENSSYVSQISPVPTVHISVSETNAIAACTSHESEGAPLIPPQTTS